MKKVAIILMLVTVIFILMLSGCRSGPQKYMLSKEEAQKERAKMKTGLANPATLHCMNTSGATWQAKEDPDGGQYGICKFSDGSWCEEWAYYKEACMPGENLTSCVGQYWGKSVCPAEYEPVCGKIDLSNATLEDYAWMEFPNSCQACTFLGENDKRITVGYLEGVCPG